MNAGKQQEAMNVLQEAYNNGGERFKAWLPTVTGVSRAAWEAQKYGMKGLIEPWKFAKEAALEYHKTMVNLETIFESTWKSMSYTMLEGIVKLTGSTGLDDLNNKARKFADDFKKYFDGPVMDTLKTTYQEAKAIIDFIERHHLNDIDPGKIVTEMQKKPEGISGYTAKSGAGVGPMQGMIKLYEWLGKQFSTEAHAGELEPGSTLLKQDTEEDSKKSLQDMRDIIQKWDDQLTGGNVVSDSGVGGTGGTGGAGGGTGAQSAGSPAGLNDEGGKKIDAETMKQAEMLGRAGDVAGLQRLFAQKGYKMSGPACGIVASGYVKSAGFKPPPGGAIATSWHKWGEGIKDPNDINAPGRTFGSMVGTYWHGRYGGTQGQILAPGQTGGHVMTIVPGTYDPKTGTVDMVDQYGYSHGKRSIKDIDLRFAGAEAVAAVEAAKGNQRSVVDKSLTTQSGWPTNASANINVNMNNVPPGVSTNADADGAFKTLKLNRNNQMAYE
jgi:hypothetical protein